MSQLPQKCLVDTNIPLVANTAIKGPLPGDEPYPEELVEKCIAVLEHITKGNGILVLDYQEIQEEYGHKLKPNEQGAGDQFLKWLFIHGWDPRKTERIKITPDGNHSYKEFPAHPNLQDFDPADKKFVATANAHSEKPPIMEALDCKWVGWEPYLRECGLTLMFVDEPYIREQYASMTKT